MKTRPLSLLRPALGLSVALLLAACTSSAAGGWTFVPPAGTPAASGAPASGTPASGAPSSPAASGQGGASAAPGASMPGMSMAPGASGAPVASGGTAGGNTITLDETGSLQITDPNGQPVKSITVKKGETYHFKITNSAGFTHNFYVGKVSDLEAANTANLTGTGDFTSGTKEFDYTFNDTQDIGFGCIVPGHYQAGMSGTFTVQ